MIIDAAVNYDPNSKIWFTSDLHFWHDKEFIYKARGFESVDKMNDALIKNINNNVTNNDHLILLGDLALGGNTDATPLISQLYGKKRLIVGNHDTPRRLMHYWGFFEEEQNFWTFTYKSKLGRIYQFILSHYPIITWEEKELNQDTNPCFIPINLHGHTHSKEKFYNDNPFCYHVGIDAHNNYPVEIEEIIEQIENKLEEKKKCL